MRLRIKAPDCNKLMNIKVGLHGDASIRKGYVLYMNTEGDLISYKLREMCINEESIRFKIMRVYNYITYMISRSILLTINSKVTQKLHSFIHSMGFRRIQMTNPVIFPL